MSTKPSFFARIRGLASRSIVGTGAMNSTLDYVGSPVLSNQELSLVTGPRQRGELPKYPLVGVFVPQEPEMHVELLSAFVQGIKRCGRRHFVVPLENGWQKCDVAVTFGVYKLATPRGVAIGKIIQGVRECNAEQLVLERGFFHRDRYFMAGWNGLNGRADFRNRDVPDDRWQQLGIELSSWRTSGDHVLVCGQVPWDASVQHVDFNQWCHQTLNHLRQLTDRPIVFRPHPCQPNALNIKIDGVRVSTNGSLRNDLENAWCAITFNSNAGVEAAVKGIPVYAADAGSMASPISNTTIEQGVMQPWKPERNHWLHRLAYAQWTRDEIAQGQAWDHLSNETCTETCTAGVNAWS